MSRSHSTSWIQPQDCAGASGTIHASEHHSSSSSEHPSHYSHACSLRERDRHPLQTSTHISNPTGTPQRTSRAAPHIMARSAERRISHDAASCRRSADLRPDPQRIFTPPSQSLPAANATSPLARMTATAAAALSRADYSAQPQREARSAAYHAPDMRARSVSRSRALSDLRSRSRSQPRRSDAGFSHTSTATGACRATGCANAYAAVAVVQVVFVGKQLTEPRLAAIAKSVRAPLSRMRVRVKRRLPERCGAGC